MGRPAVRDDGRKHSDCFTRLSSRTTCWLGLTESFNTRLKYAARRHPSICDDDFSRAGGVGNRNRFELILFCNEAALAFTCTFADFFAIVHVHETVSVSLIVSIAIVQFDRLALPERFL